MLAEAPSSQELAVSLALKHRNIGLKVKYRIFVSSTKKKNTSLYLLICNRTKKALKNVKIGTRIQKSVHYNHYFTISGFIVSGLYCIGLVI